MCKLPVYSLHACIVYNSSILGVLSFEIWNLSIVTATLFTNKGEFHSGFIIIG